MSCENRETFFARLKRPPFSQVLTPRDLLLIEGMYILAKYGHRGQFRMAQPGREPERYFEHPRGVALIIIDELQLAVAPAIILALGHDCDEDSEQVVWQLLEVLFGEEIAAGLRLLSKRGKRTGEYVQLLAEYAGWIVLIVKAADRLHNLRTLPADDQAFCRRQIRETRDEYLPLFRQMIEITPLGHRQKARDIYYKIRAIVADYEERLRKEDESA